ncbi:hypothetical protein MAHJHV59_47730 [Mycobacterium avium subsp. hominissuis]
MVVVGRDHGAAAGDLVAHQLRRHALAAGEITAEMAFIAAREGMPAELVRDEVARGRAGSPAVRSIVASGSV